MCQVLGMPRVRYARNSVFQACQEPGRSGARYFKDVLELGMSGVRNTYTLCQVQLIANSNSLKLKSCGSCGIVS